MHAFPISLNAQQIMDSTQLYTHNQKASFKSQFFQKVASVFGVKKIIEKTVTKNKYNQDVAPIPKSLRKKFDITHTTIKERSVWTIKPQKDASEKVILYLHGGVYYANISKYNWAFTEELLEKTAATVIVPDYPLAPDAKCDEVYNYLDLLYEDLIIKYPPKNMIFMGESAGGGLALGYAMSLRDEKKPQPNQLILLAPWLDVTMSNPDILEIDENDKILGIKGLQMAGKSYAGQLETDNYKVSPIYGELSDLPKISIFVGTHDLFVADSRKLKNKAISLDIPINYYEYPKMFHVWILANKLKEAKFAMDQIKSLVLSE